uniref:Fibrous sheath-interacting protein 1 n=1 Tax=Trichobilharzia regenti TaxID=157069 RepID=A0AA85JNV0_TRIRE|nr:unnamed protein product [Trichobilharzia regenti]
MTKDEGLKNLWNQFVFPNGDYYEGEYIMGNSGVKRHGEGKLISKFRSGVLDVANDNTSVQSSKHLVKFILSCQNKKDFDISMLSDLFGESGLHHGCYTGQWVNDMIDGFGKVEFASGSYYEGNFKENKMHGFGTYYWPNGYILKAQFEQNYIKHDSDPVKEDTDSEYNYLTELPFSTFSLTDSEEINQTLEEINHLFDSHFKTNDIYELLNIEQTKSRQEDAKIIKGKKRIKLLDTILNSKLREEKEVKEKTRILHKEIENEFINLLYPDIKSIQKFKNMKKHNSQLDNTGENSNQLVLASDTFEQFNPLSNEICRNIEKFLKLNKLNSSLYDDTKVNKKKGKFIHQNCGTVDDIKEEGGFACNSIFKTECMSRAEVCMQKKKEERIDKLLDEGTGVNSSTFSEDNQMSSQSEYIHQNSSFAECVFNPFNAKSKRSNKNFIKRNIELASRWMDVMPMTAEEEARIEELLADQDEDIANKEGSVTFQNALNENEDASYNAHISPNGDNCQPKRNSPGAFWLCLKGTRRNNQSVNKGQQDALDASEQQSVNQLVVKETNNQLDNQTIGMLSRLNEIEEQLEKLQIQRKLDDEKSLDVISSTKSSQQENKARRESINHPGECTLMAYQEIREMNERLSELDTRLAQIQQTNFEELSTILFLIAYTKLWSNSSSNPVQLEVDLNILAPNNL